MEGEESGRMADSSGGGGGGDGGGDPPRRPPVGNPYRRRQRQLPNAQLANAGNASSTQASATSTRTVVVPQMLVDAGLDPTALLGYSQSAIDGRRTATVYLNRFLGGDDSELYYNDRYPTSMDKLTDEHVSGDLLKKFLSHFGLWLATNRHKSKNSSNPLNVSALEDYFKFAKEVLKHKFGSHELFNRGNIDWWNELRGKFVTEATRCKKNDQETAELRQAYPLYRDLSDNNSAVRARYLGSLPVDAKTIGMRMISKMDPGTARRFTEHTLGRNVIGRASEHLFARWDEGAYDSRFRCLDVDWQIIKQLDKQCMLMYCDLHLYCLCPIFAFGVFFLYGNLQRAGVSDVKKPFIFFYLQDVKQKSLSKRLTDTVREHCPDPEQKRILSSKSTKKGVMTENRMNPDLSIKEELNRSGHTGSETNSNAEGYICATPAASHPGAMAVSGYKNCHGEAWPYSFDCLGMDVVDTVKRLIAKLFIIDVPQLKEGGKLYPLTLMAAARLVGTFHQLLKDFPNGNPIISKILEGAREAGVDDARVPQKPGPRHHAVLLSWSRQIHGDFKNKNRELPLPDASVATQLSSVGEELRATSNKVDGVDEKVETLEANMELIMGHFNLQANEMKKLKAESASKDNEIRRLNKELQRQRRANAAFLSSPSTPNRRSSADLMDDDSSDDGSAQGSKKQRTGEVATPTAQENGDGRGSLAATPSTINSTTANVLGGPSLPTNANETETARRGSTENETSTNETRPTLAQALNGSGLPATMKIGGIKVVDELERLWKNDTLAVKAATLVDGTVLPKKVLFDSTHDLFVDYHPAFKENEQAKYKRAMQLVAMAISTDHWGQLIAADLEDEQMRELFAEIQKLTMEKAFRLEIQSQLRKADAKPAKSLSPTLSSLSGRLVNIRKSYVTHGQSDLGVDNIFAREAGGSGSTSRQSTLTGFGSGS